MKRTLYLAVVLWVFALAAFGDVTGTITGVVSDQSGAVIPNVPVTVTNTGTNAVFQATSNDLGVFTIGALPVGVYKQTFDASQLPAGLYFYRLEAGSFNDIRKMILLK